jgi:hypothetical protein
MLDFYLRKYMQQGGRNFVQNEDGYIPLCNMLSVPRKKNSGVSFIYTPQV